MSLARTARNTVRRSLPRSVQMRVRRRRQARLIERYAGRTHEGEYGGHALTLRFEDPLAEGWYGHDWPLLPEIEHLRGTGRVRAGARVFDLGAHQGVVALILAAEVGATGQVVAVEADAHNARIAAINVALNGRDAVSVVNAAVSDREGVLSFAPGLNGRVEEQTTAGTVAVPATTIDALAAKYGPPDLVFIDIEGFEGRALGGAGRVLATDAAFFVEVHVDRLVDATAADIVAAFDAHDVVIARDPLTPAARYEFVPLHGPPPDDRFYLIATRGRSSG